MAVPEPVRVHLPVSLLHPFEGNPNKMTEREMDLLIENMERVGFTDPALVFPLDLKLFTSIWKKHRKAVMTTAIDSTAAQAFDEELGLQACYFRTVGGHHRIEGAKFLEFSRVPCTVIMDPAFDLEQAEIQLMRHNAIKGKLDPQKFFNLYEKYLTKGYESDTVQELFGFADAAEFKKLIEQSAATLPKDLQAKFKEAAAEIKTIDGLAKLLNQMFCHDEETEFLATDGWHSWEGYVPGMEVAVFDASANKLAWTKDVKLYVFDAVDAPVFRIEGKSTDVCVTTGHRMLSGDVYGTKWSVVPVENLVDHSVWSFKTRCIVDEEGELPQDQAGIEDPRDFVELVAWYAAEGHTHSGRSTAICITQKREDGLEVLHALTARLTAAGRSVMGPYYQSCGTEKVYFNGLKKWAIANCGKGAADKRLPAVFLRLPVDLARLVFETLMLGDGHWREDGYGSYVSLSKTLADQVQILALRLGYKAYVYQSNGLWVVSITSGCGHTTVRRSNVGQELYTGKTWCFETPTGFFVTRRNGKISFHGNTMYGDTLPFGYMILDHGGQNSIWLRLENKKTWDAITLLGQGCIEMQRTMDDLFGYVLQSLAKGEQPDLIKAALDNTKPVKIPSSMVALPTKDALAKVEGLTDA